MFVCSSEVYNKNGVGGCVGGYGGVWVGASERVRNGQLCNFIYAHTSDMCHVCTDRLTIKCCK